MKKKTLALSVLSLAMCGSLVAGCGSSAVNAPSTSEENFSTEVNSGEIKVAVTVSDLDVFSPIMIYVDGSFAKTEENNGSVNGSFVCGGSATKVDNVITLEKMTAGDSVDFTITVANESSVAVKYRTVLWVEEDDGLFDGLEITVGGQLFTYTMQSEWRLIAPGSVDIPVSIELPVGALKEYQGKSATIAFKVEANSV